MSETRSAARANLLTWLALMGLAAATLLLSRAPLGHAAIPVALGIGAVKAVLIALIFMHLSEETRSSRVAAALGVFLVLLLVFFATADVMTRQGPYLKQPMPAMSSAPGVPVGAERPDAPGPR